jgi:pullulanase
LVIYETQLAALSRHASSGANAQDRGTFRGVQKKPLDHLKRLGVAVEFMPLHASDPEDGADWRYFSTSFRAFAGDLAGRHRHDAPREFKRLVDRMHREGTPVIVDVVFNHGGELLVRALGQDLVYRKLSDGEFDEGSGCGPTVATERPIIRETMIQSLENLVENYHVDGFRFDLGALHDIDTMVAIDRRLPEHVFLTSEPWALSGAQWGKEDLNRRLRKTRWTAWNDHFRDPAKTFLTNGGDFENRDKLQRAIKGSLAADGGWAARPQQSINYLTSHDGLTLADFHKDRPQRQLLGMMMVLTSQGIPMIAEGSEFMHTKGDGEHNSYNKPEFNQLDWRQAEQHEKLVDATAKLIQLRKDLPHFKYTQRLRDGKGQDIEWIHPTGYPDNDNTNAIGYILKPPPSARKKVAANEREIIVLFNGSDRWTSFNVPEGNWRILADGDTMEVDRKGLAGRVVTGDYGVPTGVGVILAPE